MSKSFYVGVVTDFRPDKLIMSRKASPEVYDFRKRDLTPDTRSWWHGDQEAWTPASSPDNLADFAKAEKVYDEILLKKMNWKPLVELQGSPEYLNHVCIVRCGEAGEETIERLWVADEASSYVIDKHDGVILPKSPRFKKTTFEDFFGIVHEENLVEFNAIREYPRKLVRFPETSFTVIQLADDLNRTRRFVDQKRRTQKTDPAGMQLILENHIGMGFRLTDGDDAWFFRLQAEYADDQDLGCALAVDQSRIANEVEADAAINSGIICEGSWAYEWLYTRKSYYFEVAFLPGS